MNIESQASSFQNDDGFSHSPIRNDDGRRVSVLICIDMYAVANLHTFKSRGSHENNKKY